MSGKQASTGLASIEALSGAKVPVLEACRDINAAQHAFTQPGAARRAFLAAPGPPIIFTVYCTSEWRCCQARHLNL